MSGLGNLLSEAERITMVKYMQDNPDMMNSRLHGNAAIREWDNNAREMGSVGPSYDYTNSGTTAANGHSSDIGKLPWHVTFSDQSAYHNRPELGNVKGGTWVGETYTMLPSQETPNRLGELQWLMDKGYNDGATYIKSDGTKISKGK